MHTRSSTSRWEAGSEFHRLTYEESAEPTYPWQNQAALFGSGRDALRALLIHGQANLGWRRLLIPGYFCQEVVASILTTGIDTQVYDGIPGDPAVNSEHAGLQLGAVLLCVNYFGLRAKPSTDISAGSQYDVIEDHTHDPCSEWARTSTADWCIASLRKTLPLPDGGVVWSPSGRSLPVAPPASAERSDASLRKLAAMVLKRLYLDGHTVDKETFRQLSVAGEAGIGSGEISGMPAWTRSLLRTFPVDRWRELRRRNHMLLSKVLSGLDWLSVLQPDSGSGACPFSAILVFDSSDRRDYVRRKLIESDVYPSILWPLERPAVQGISHRCIDFSRSMLSVYCDMRYRQRDMEVVASMVRRYGDQYHQGE